jgi:hypothetical protein
MFKTPAEIVRVCRIGRSQRYSGTPPFLEVTREEFNEHRKILSSVALHKFTKRFGDRCPRVSDDCALVMCELARASSIEYSIWQRASSIAAGCLAPDGMAWRATGSGIGCVHNWLRRTYTKAALATTKEALDRLEYPEWATANKSECAKPDR